MQKIYTTIALIFLVSLSKAQSIPNAGFENWTNFGGYSDPTSWTSFNSLTAITSTFTCEKGTPGATGSAYLKLTVKNIPGIGLFGGIALSAPSFTTFGPGFACNARPANLTGKWQYLVTGNDSSIIEVLFFKWNSSTQTSDLMGVGAEVIAAGAVTSWTNFSTPINYFNGSTPDSALILINAGASNPVLNDYLYIDELAFSGTSAGIVENSKGASISITPNPFNSQTIISFSEEQRNVTVKIIDALGKEVKEIIFTGNKLILEKEKMKEGIYFIQIYSGQNIYTRRIVIE